MDEQISNNVSQPAAIPQASTGPSIEELQTKLQEAERAREGLLREAQSERAKRHELEQRLNAVPAPQASTPSPVVNQDDELAKVLNPYVAPFAQKAEYAYAELQRMKAEAEQSTALGFLSSKTKKSREEIMADKALQDRLTSVVNKWGLSGSLADVTRRAYELMEIEDARSKEHEAARVASASQTQSLPVGGSPKPAVSSSTYSASDFNALSSREFDRLSQTGDFRKNPDGSFSYIPR